jgi:predicted dinucleotide-binding enzyme
VSAVLLADLDHQLDEDVLVCGDRREDKARVAELVQRIPGLRRSTAASLEMARIVEQLTPLLISINVRTRRGRDQDHRPSGEPASPASGALW